MLFCLLFDQLLTQANKCPIEKNFSLMMIELSLIPDSVVFQLLDMMSLLLQCLMMNLLMRRMVMCSPEQQLLMIQVLLVNRAYAAVVDLSGLSSITADELVSDEM